VLLHASQTTIKAHNPTVRTPPKSEIERKPELLLKEASRSITPQVVQAHHIDCSKPNPNWTESPSPKAKPSPKLEHSPRQQDRPPFKKKSSAAGVAAPSNPSKSSQAHRSVSSIQGRRSLSGNTSAAGINPRPGTTANTGSRQGGSFGVRASPMGAGLPRPSTSGGRPTSKKKPAPKPAWAKLPPKAAPEN